MEVGTGMSWEGRRLCPPEKGVSTCIWMCPPSSPIGVARCFGLPYLVSLATPIAQIGKLGLPVGGNACPGHGTRKGQSQHLNLGLCLSPDTSDFAAFSGCPGLWRKF